jgi:hypothetical protein
MNLGWIKDDMMLEAVAESRTRHGTADGIDTGWAGNRPHATMCKSPEGISARLSPLHRRGSNASPTQPGMARKLCKSPKSSPAQIGF